MTHHTGDRMENSTCLITAVQLQEERVLQAAVNCISGHTFDLRALVSTEKKIHFLIQVLTVKRTASPVFTVKMQTPHPQTQPLLTLKTHTPRALKMANCLL